MVFKSIQLAFMGRIFEGFATDNLLHYNLSAVYITASDKSRFPRLMGTSLALFMIGMSVSPTIAGLLPSFFASFIMALSVFAASILYLAVSVPVVSSTLPHGTGPSPAHTQPSPNRSLLRRLLSLSRPLTNLRRDRRVILPCVALLLYNTTQAYLFPALMVYTALNFSFTGKQNGYLISIAATVSAVYLLVVLYVIPKLRRRLGWAAEPSSTAEGCEDGGGASEGFDSTTAGKSSRHEFIFAVLSMSTQLVALPCVYLTTEGWQVYPLVAVIALGLAAPSFIKSYGVSLAMDKSSAVASLAMMESLGGLLSALVLGAWQSYQGPGVVFLAAAGLVAAAVLVMLASRLVGPSRAMGY